MLQNFVFWNFLGGALQFELSKFHCISVRSGTFAMNSGSFSKATCSCTSADVPVCICICICMYQCRWQTSERLHHWTLEFPVPLEAFTFTKISRIVAKEQICMFHVYLLHVLMSECRLHTEKVNHFHNFTHGFLLRSFWAWHSLMNGVMKEQSTTVLSVHSVLQSWMVSHQWTQK